MDFDQEDIDGGIYMILLLRPDHVYVTADGTKAYVLNDDQSDLLVVHGTGLHEMSGEDLHAYVRSNLN